MNSITFNPSHQAIEPTSKNNSAKLVLTDAPLVSVIIPAYNSVRYIQKAIDSVLSQTYGNYEIIVVDDGSTDETRQKLSLYQTKIRYVFQENQGSAAARNTGIKLANGDLVAFLDSDDFWSMPEKLEKQVACFQDNPELGGLNTGWRIVDGVGQHLKTVQPWHKAPKLDLETWLKKKCVRTSAMMFRRSWLEKVGGFDPELRQSHDVDLILRLSLAGCETDWLKEETVCYRQHDSNTTKDSLKQARYIQAVLDKFFARNDVPDDISKQEGQIRYHTLVWIAWYQYNAGNLDEMAKFLQQSLDFSPYLRAENIAHWLDNFKRFTEERGCQSNIDSLTNSLQWQRLIAFTLELDQNKFQHLQQESPQNEKRLNELLNQVEELLAEKEKLDQEIASYRRTLEIQPNSPEFKQKSVATSKSKSKPSKQKYKFNVPLNASVEDYRKLAEALQKKGEFAEIADLYRLAVQRNPDSYKLYKNLGEILVKQKQIDEAVLAYQKSVELNPQFAWSYKGLGEALELKGRRSEAIASYQKAIKLKSEVIEKIHPRLEALLDAEGRWDEAVDLYRYAFKKKPSDRRLQAKIYEKLGDSFIHQKNWEQANTNFVKALQIEPDYFQAYEKIAYVLEQQGNPITLPAEATSPSTYCELPQDFLEKYCNLAENWLVDSRSDSKINHIPVYPSSQIEFPSTKTLEGKEIPSCMQYQDVQVAEAFVVELAEGRAWGDRITTAMITPDNQLVSQTYSGAAELIVSSDQLPPAQYIDGTVVFLSVRWGAVGYFHWIFDILTRLELLRLSGIDFESIDKFVINRYGQKFQIETLTHFGIPREKIIESSKVPHIQAKSLIVPSLPQLRAYRDARWACNALKQRFINPQDLQSFGKLERIYINRKDAPHRRVVNEDQVISFLEDWGFTSIALESMSFSEQVLCMASAKIVVAVHGAGLSNLVFCNPGTKVLEIFSPAHVQNTYWRISNVCELEHYHLMSDDTHPDVDLSERSVKRDVCVNLDDLTKLFKIANIEQPNFTQKSYQNQMRLVPNNSILYRTLGNDLPPRHNQGQTIENLKFILDNEPPLTNCQKRWVINRMVDREQERAIIQLLKERDQTYIHIPFIEEEYAQIDFNYQGFPHPDYFNTKEYQNLKPSQQERALDHLYHYKNIYVMNNNGSRNAALREGKNLAKWVLPWDGNCFLTENAWQEIIHGINQCSDAKYLIVPMARVLSNEQLLDPDFRPDAAEEPQIIFRQDAVEEFNERTVRYGHFSKLELFKRLGVPGQWDQWGYDPWDIKGRQTSRESGQFKHIGWVARLFSGKPELEKDGTQRQYNRLLAIRNLLDNLDEQINSKSKDSSV